MPVPARAELVSRVVAVHQVDAAGDRLDPVDDGRQVLAGRESVTGVQAEADLAAAIGGVADGVPQPRDGVQAAGHRAVAASGVLDQHGQRPVDPLDGLAPAVIALLRVDSGGDMPAVHDQALGADGGRRGQLLLEQLAAGNPDPVIRRGDVDDVRGVHVGLDAGPLEAGPELVRLDRERGCLPALRVAKEELDSVGVDRLRVGQRVTVMQMRTNPSHLPSVSAATDGLVGYPKPRPTRSRRARCRAPCRRTRPPGRPR